MRWLRNAIERLKPARRLQVVESDTLPERLPRRDLVLAREDGEDWAVGLLCPCGCGERLELMTLDVARPRWDLTCDRQNRPSLYPSIWRKTGCGAHFWLRCGRIYWV